MHGVPCGMRGARVHVLIHGVPSVSGARVARVWDALYAVWNVLSADAWCAVRDAWCTGVWCAGVECVELSADAWCAVWDAWCTGACPYSWCAERLRCEGSADVGCVVRGCMSLFMVCRASPVRG